MERVSSGIAALDGILNGGLPSRRLYLLEGVPGSGKTTVGLQFLMAGVEQGERVLYITLSETVEELREVAASHGWTLDGIDLFEFGHAELAMALGDEQSVLHSWEVELGEVVQLITASVDKVMPTRVVFDSLSDLRLLAQDALRFRRQILALKQFFAGRNITVILMDDMTGRASSGGSADVDLHSLAHGVMTLDRLTLDFGIVRRRFQVQKLRGSTFREGYHDMAIVRGGVEIFPRLVAMEHHTEFRDDPVPSGLSSLDALLGGGPLRGSSTLITGPAGVGKTTIALQYIAAACARGERCVLYEFDERVGTLLVRANAVGIHLQPYIEQDLLHLRQVDPSEISPGQFATMVRTEVEQHDARLIVVDSINGYIAAMPQERELILQLHEILSYLNQRGVLTLLINPQNGMLGAMAASHINISYVADAVILLRFFESQGRVRKAISALKNRSGAHEDKIREFAISADGIRISDALDRFDGVLSGTPAYRGASESLLNVTPSDA